MPDLDLAMAVVLSLTGAGISTVGAMLTARLLKQVCRERREVARLVDAHMDWVLRYAAEKEKADA